MIIFLDSLSYRTIAMEGMGEATCADGARHAARRRLYQQRGRRV